jgi:hypothetical protein
MFILSKSFRRSITGKLIEGQLSILDKRAPNVYQIQNVICNFQSVELVFSSGSSKQELVTRHDASVSVTRGPENTLEA